jgi:hypothetical protein
MAGIPLLAAAGFEFTVDIQFVTFVRGDVDSGGEQFIQL